MYVKVAFHKKVLLRERKRHTTRRVSSTSSAVLSRGISHPWLEGVPHPMVPPILTWPGGTLARGTQSLGRGYPIPGTDLGPVPGVPLERMWDQWKYCGMEMGTAPPRKNMGQLPPPPRVWTDKQTETITFFILRMRAVIKTV